MLKNFSVIYYVGDQIKAEGPGIGRRCGHYHCVGDNIWHHVFEIFKRDGDKIKGT